MKRNEIDIRKWGQRAFVLSGVILLGFSSWAGISILTQESVPMEKTLAVESVALHREPANVGAAGYRVYLDADGNPATPPPGTFTPTPNGNRGSGEIIPLRSNGVNGGETVDFEGRLRMYAVAHVDEQGAVSLDCVDDVDSDHDHVHDSVRSNPLTDSDKE